MLFRVLCISVLLMSCGWLWKSVVHKVLSEYIFSDVAE